jgi:primase-polymerase (primpol)-like protein
MGSKREREKSTQKPSACKIHFAGIPQELKVRPQWVLWSFKRRKGKWTKIPYQPGGEEAASDDPSTWNPYDQVVSRGKVFSSQYDGIGYEFAEDDPYTGIDLDDAIEPETKQFKPWAQVIVDQLNSYTEISPSETGVKIWVRAHKPSNDRCRIKYEDGEVEIYDRERYFAMTGRHWSGTQETIEDRQAEVEALYHLLFSKKQANKKPQQESVFLLRVGTRFLSDAELVKKAQESDNGGKFSRLLAGDIPSPFQNRLIVVEDIDAWPCSQYHSLDCWAPG